ncbi:MAG: hypothetical protein DRI57_10690 [Deltaproteobacteria bacterium]|nr:MAG: hypothetical protein DRI57_10690 [Deltaproteobacteria bacterium]
MKKNLDFLLKARICSFSPMQNVETKTEFFWCVPPFAQKAAQIKCAVMADQFSQKISFDMIFAWASSDLCSATTMNFKISGVKGSETEFFAVLNPYMLIFQYFLPDNESNLKG